VVTWAVTDSSSITANTPKSLTIDGAAATAIYGPYGPYGSSYYYAGVFGPLAAGSHNYVIQMTDSTGASTTYSGSFTVVAAPAIKVSAAPRVQAAALSAAEAAPLLAAQRQSVVADASDQLFAALPGDQDQTWF